MGSGLLTKKNEISLEGNAGVKQDLLIQNDTSCRKVEQWVCEGRDGALGGRCGSGADAVGATVAHTASAIAEVMKSACPEGCTHKA